MQILQFLIQYKETIIEKWFQLIIKTYPKDSENFFYKTKERFNNPVGYTIHNEINTIFDKLVDDIKQNSFTDEHYLYPLQQITKIRAVQDFKPSQAVAFILLLKDAVRTILLKKSNAKTVLYEELIPLETCIDQLSLLTFDQYMASRELIFTIKLKEIKTQQYL